MIAFSSLAAVAAKRRFVVSDVACAASVLSGQDTLVTLPIWPAALALAHQSLTSHGLTALHGLVLLQRLKHSTAAARVELAFDRDERLDKLLLCLADGRYLALLVPGEKPLVLDCVLMREVPVVPATCLTHTYVNLTVLIGELLAYDREQEKCNATDAGHHVADAASATATADPQQPG
jgi:hypothetical protein